jgi:hypothetical protein
MFAIASLSIDRCLQMAVQQVVQPIGCNVLLSSLGLPAHGALLHTNGAGASTITTGPSNTGTFTETECTEAANDASERIGGVGNRSVSVAAICMDRCSGRMSTWHTAPM